MNYDVEEHYRRWKWMIGCFVVMVCLWIACWLVSWQAALVACLANLYFLFGLGVAFTLYPPKRDEYDQ